MSYIDDDLKRVLKYAESLGIKVYFKKPIRGAGGAEWDMIDKSIHIYASKSTPKTTILLNMLHELGHHLDWIYNNKSDSAEAFTAYKLLNEGNMFGDRSDIPKHYRKVIYEEETAGVYYMDIIHKELDLKIPLWKVKLEQDLDLFDYRMLYVKGKFSTAKEFKDYNLSKTKKYKRVYGKKKK